MGRDTGQGHFKALAHTARREGNLEFFGEEPRVIVKGLVEITHPEH